MFYTSLVTFEVIFYERSNLDNIKLTQLAKVEVLVHHHRVSKNAVGLKSWFQMDFSLIRKKRRKRKSYAQLTFLCT